MFAMASTGGKLLSAEERRRQKELDEARKAGLAAPEVRPACGSGLDTLGTVGISFRIGDG